MNKFAELGLSDKICKVLDKLKFEQPTPIQEKAIPLLLNDTPTDFIGLAQTGTGKTAAFGLPLIEQIDVDNRNTQALIMAPTRELGQQTARQLVDFAANFKKINIQVVYGGAAIANQIRALKKPTQIVVATPGRLLDLIRRKAVDLNQVKYVVLDEADEMLNMGFKEDIDKILSHTLDDRVTWLFSATMPKEIRNIVKKYMDSPIEVTVEGGGESNKDISHKYVVTKATNKISALRRFIDSQPDMRAILFCRTKRETQKIAEDLSMAGYNVEALHGDLSQAKRDTVMRRFKSTDMPLLVATDVAARGIDVIDLTHVLHHTLPDQLESYTHRSGRTARAGKKGVSLAFINTREGRKIKELERRIKITFEKIDVPDAADMAKTRIEAWADKLVGKGIHEQAQTFLDELGDKFVDLSKEDILKRLISTQLNRMNIGADASNDLNESTSNADPSPRNADGFHRYFVNVGTVDGMTKDDLIQFLSETADVKAKHFGQMTLQKNCSYFDVDSGHDHGLGAKFKGVEIDGRSIRVNRDDQGGKRQRGPSSNFRKSKGKGNRSKFKRDFSRSKRKKR